MIAEDLMIGDFVSYEGSIYKVLSTDKVQDVTIYNDVEGYHHRPASEMEPIPLTREIVLKNFKVNEYIMEVQKKKLKVEDPEWLHLTYTNGRYEWILTWDLSLFHDDGDGFSLFIYDCPMPEIHYVHELQQFLRLCGIKEKVKL